MSARPTVGRLIVPYMVDETRCPIDFKAVDAAHVEDCARHGKCGVCGSRVRRGPIAFIGPDDGRTCFADPWMHPACAELAMRQCPFLAGRRDWRDAEGRNNPLTTTYSGNMVSMLVQNWRAHRDERGAWHFEAVGPLIRQETAS